MSQSNQYEWLLASLRMRKLQPTGKKEFASVDDIDRALASALDAAFTDLVVTEETRYNKSFCQFLSRTQRDRITEGSFTDVNAFLDTFRNAGAGRLDSKAANKQAINKMALPIVNVSRSPAFSVYDGDISKENYDAGELEEDGKTVAVVVTMPVAINYSLWVLSDERQSMGMVCAALAFWLRMYASQGQASFMTSTRLAGSEIGIHCVVQNQKSVTFSDLVTDTSADRLFAAALDLTVIADLPMAHFVDEIQGRIEVTAAVATDSKWPGTR